MKAQQPAYADDSHIFGTKFERLLAGLGTLSLHKETINALGPVSLGAAQGKLYVNFDASPPIKDWEKSHPSICDRLKGLGWRCNYKGSWFFNVE